MQGALAALLAALNWFPGLKTKIGAVAAFLLAVLAAWNSAVPEFNPDLVLNLPEWVNAFVLALIGVGAANQPANLKAAEPPKP